MRTRSHRAKIVAATAALALVAWALTGCADLLTGPVPPKLQGLSESLVDDISKMPGVDSVTAPVRDVDWKDDPGEWKIVLTVRAKTPDGLDVIPPQLSPILRNAERVTRVELRLVVPGAGGVAESVISHLAPAAVRSVLALRVLPQVKAVDDANFSVLALDLRSGASLADGVHLAQTAMRVDPTLRSVLVSGGPERQSRTGDWSVVVAPTRPSAELAGELTRLVNSGDVTSLSVDYDPAGIARPRLQIQAEDPQAVARILEAAHAEEPDAGDPTEFHVYSRSGDVEAAGVVGVVPRDSVELK